MNALLSHAGVIFVVSALAGCAATSVREPSPAVLDPSVLGTAQGHSESRLQWHEDAQGCGHSPITMRSRLKCCSSMLCQRMLG